MSTLLGVFCRHPQPGWVKSRLAAAIGGEAAAVLYHAFLADTVGQVRDLADRVVLAYTPDDAAARNWFGQVFGSGVDVWPQPAGDLGARLSAFVRVAIGEKAARVVVIGSDSPTLPREYIETAFDQLGQHDVVLGPATDGGYYLLGIALSPGSATHSLSPASDLCSGIDTNAGERAGARDRAGRGPESSTVGQHSLCEQPPPWTDVLFTAIDWSSPAVLSQTIDRINSAGRSYTLLPPWYDVDTIEDLATLRNHFALWRSAGIAGACPRTAACLVEL